MSHEHGGHGHAHAVRPDADGRYLWTALLLLAAFLVAEVVVAILSGSLALLSDAGHMLTDVASVGMALWAMHLAARPARGALTFGWRRAEILSAAINGVTLLVVGILVAVAAVGRLVHPPHVDGGPMLAVALVGIGVNIAAAWSMARANRSSLNVRGAYQHVVTDLYGFIGTTVAAIVILAVGWMRADAVASLLVVALMVRASWGLLRDSGRVLLEAAPEDVDVRTLRRHLGALEHVHGVHDLHVWVVTSQLPTVSAHLVIDDSCFRDGHAPQMLDAVQECLRGHFNVEHSTFQFEPAGHSAHESGVH